MYYGAVNKTLSVVTDAPKSKTTWQQLRPTGYPCLYRHDNGSYYGVKKVRGRKLPKALKTANGQNIAERKVAERALADWISALTAPAPLASEMTFAELYDMFLAQKAGQAQSTKDLCEWVKQCVTTTAPTLWTMRVREIKPSHLAEFFAQRYAMKATSFNTMSAHVKNILAIAVSDDIIAANPWDKVPKKQRRKKNERTPDEVPTIEECEKLVAHVRNQEFADTADKSADMLALMHLAALGQAELVALDWKDVRWSEKKIIIWKRLKTGAYFEVPFFPHLEPFLLDLWERQGKPTVGKVVSILSPAIALANACKRLKMPRYSPRDFRKARITWFLRKGVSAEQIAKWQGHKDNGILIRRVYAWVITSLDNAEEQRELAKLS